MTEVEYKITEEKVTEAQIEMGMITQNAYGLHGESIGMAFSVKLLSGTAALFLNSLEVDELVKKHQIQDLNILKGAPCSVSVDEGKVTFIELI